jgi:hypothetical protein
MMLGLLGRREPITDAVVDVGLADPAPHRLHRNVEVGSDLRVGQIAPASDSDHVTLELRRELLGHRNILPTRLHRAKAMSTDPAADPSTPLEHENLSGPKRSCSQKDGIIAEPDDDLFPSPEMDVKKLASCHAVNRTHNEPATLTQTLNHIMKAKCQSVPIHDMLQDVYHQCYITLLVKCIGRYICLDESKIWPLGFELRE